MANVGQICTTLNSLESVAFNILNRIANRYEMAKRLADILERAGELVQFQLPDLAQLIPIGAIDITTYTQLVRGCPELGLTPPIGDGLLQVESLRSQVFSAYQELADVLSASPWARLGVISDPINNAIRQADNYFSTATNGVSTVFGCLNNLCQGAYEISGLPQAARQSSIKTYQELQKQLLSGGAVTALTGNQMEKLKYTKKQISIITAKMLDTSDLTIGLPPLR